MLCQGFSDSPLSFGLQKQKGTGILEGRLENLSLKPISGAWWWYRHRVKNPSHVALICILPFPSLSSSCSGGTFRFHRYWRQNRCGGWRWHWWWWSRIFGHRTGKNVLQPIVPIVFPKIKLLSMCNLLHTHTKNVVHLETSTSKCSQSHQISWNKNTMTQLTTKFSQMEKKIQRKEFHTIHLEGAKSRKHRMGPHSLTHQVCNTKMEHLSYSSTDIPSDHIQLSKTMCKC